MIPILTPDEMGAVDRAAPEPVEVLIGRAAAAVARAAVELLGGTYGRRVVVVAGKGNNGNDGREAARRLRGRGVRVTVVEAGAVERLTPCDLVIDAAYGTGFRGSYAWPVPASGDGPAPRVLAVDIPSGVDGLTGQAGPGVGRADTTVTFAALKPGLLFEPGASRTGPVVVADIGLDVSGARAHLVTDADVADWWPARAAASHKWQAAVWVVAGSAGMEGAAVLACAGAQRAGAGYVRQSSPGSSDSAGSHLPVEVVRHRLADPDWADDLVDTRRGIERFGAIVIGNGLGTDPDTQAQIRKALAGLANLAGLGGAGAAAERTSEAGRAQAPAVVVDADGLTALGTEAAGLVGPSTVLTPHDGEYARLAGEPPGPDRMAAARQLAARLGCVVLLKGGPTVVADAEGRVAVVSSGDARLATAGTGDVLAGMVGALCARGLDPWRAAAAAAFLHGRAAALGWSEGFVAGDVVDHLPAAIDRLRGARRAEG